METLISKLQVPFYIIMVLLAIIALGYMASAYDSYWQGKLARQQYYKNEQ
jgi:hypothetical protein